jgi:transglutaminase-like putative cysteine protease
MSFEGELSPCFDLRCLRRGGPPVDGWGIGRALGEATHAWAQVYLPEAGWKGFDPTNGVLTQTNHVRVAVGRHYTDATPTSGTIFAGGGAEQLEVVVTVEEEG